ncbi:MAG: heme-binding protein [Alphaproteobacteria bacterium]|nr:heme-binding protein [Alphaproteobacteria bacterium]
MKIVYGAMVAGAALWSMTAAAQVPEYGTTVNLAQAKAAIAAGQAEAAKNKWPVAIAVVDNHGFLVAYEKMDGTQNASVQVAIDKAVSAAIYRRSTKVFQDLVAGGGAGTRVMGLRGASVVEGGLPIMVGGKIVGGIGVSGVTSDQDGVVAKAGVDVVK